MRSERFILMVVVLVSFERRITGFGPMPRSNLIAICRQRSLVLSMADGTVSSGSDGDSASSSKSTFRVGWRRKNRSTNNNNKNNNMKKKSRKRKKRLKKLLAFIGATMALLLLLKNIFSGGVMDDSSGSGGVVYYQSSVYESRIIKPDGSVETSRKESFRSNIPELVKQQRLQEQSEGALQALPDGDFDREIEREMKQMQRDFFDGVF